MPNVTARHGQAAVHLGGHEFNGRWSPACGTQHHNAGGREVTPLRPTDKPVTCKRCLKKVSEQTRANAVEARRQQAKAALKPVTSVQPAVDEHAAAVAQMYANIDAEEEKRAAARRARNRSNYASHPVGRKLTQDHGLNFF